MHGRVFVYIRECVSFCKGGVFLLLFSMIGGGWGRVYSNFAKKRESGIHSLPVAYLKGALSERVFLVLLLLLLFLEGGRGGR